MTWDCWSNADILPCLGTLQTWPGLGVLGWGAGGKQIMTPNSQVPPPHQPAPVFIWSLCCICWYRVVSCIHYDWSHDCSDTWQLPLGFGWQETKIALAELIFQVRWIISAKSNSLAWHGLESFTGWTSLAFLLLMGSSCLHSAPPGSLCMSGIVS